MKPVSIILFILLSASSFSQTVTTGQVEFVEKSVGNKAKQKPLSVEYESNPRHVGYQEVGTFMHISKVPACITDANFIINAKKFPDSLVFTINIYSIKDGLPNENILYRPIRVTINKKKGIFTVDLKQYNICVKEDFFLSLQWRDGTPGSISFGGGMFGYNSLHRTDSGEWEKVPMLKLGFFATVRYPK